MFRRFAGVFRYDGEARRAIFAAWLAAIALGTTASRSIGAAPSLAELASD